MKAVEDASVDAVFFTILSISSSQVPVALAEFHRVLKPDGFVLLTCPDLQSVCSSGHDQLTEPAIKGMGPIAPLDILYGHRVSMKAGNSIWRIVGFNKKVLAATLSSAGFDNGVKARLKFSISGLLH